MIHHPLRCLKYTICVFYLFFLTVQTMWTPLKTHQLHVNFLKIKYLIPQMAPFHFHPGNKNSSSSPLKPLAHVGTLLAKRRTSLWGIPDSGGAVIFQDFPHSLFSLFSFFSCFRTLELNSGGLNRGFPG